MAATMLCNRVNCLSRIIARNTYFSRVTSHNGTFRGRQALLSSRFFSSGVKDTKDAAERPVNEKKNGDQAGEQTRENDPYAPFPDNVNPITGERGGPKGPEPTRYGDWERKGRSHWLAVLYRFLHKDRTRKSQPKSTTT